MKNLFVLALALLALFPQNSYSRNYWEHQSKPAKGAPESIGTQSNGCMIGADTLPLDGPNFQVMRPSRNRYYTSPETKDYIYRLANDVKQKLHNELIVGDLSLPKGGPFSFGHRSHQNGLDADIWYTTPRAANFRKLSRVEREKIQAISLVDLQQKKLNDNWNSYYRNLLKIAASYPEVDRIFVNAAIKRELCETDKGADWMEKIRPWWNHEDHFHVRIKCPENSPDCKLPNYENVAKGDGCDETLGWWFKKPTKEEIEKFKLEKANERKNKPKLPLKCQQLMKK